MNINYYMNLAIEQAKKAEKSNEVPVGALLVDESNNQIISKAKNNVIGLNNPIKHAELILIDDACKKLNSKYLFKTSIFVTLEPCTMCAAAISEAKIGKIYFGAYDQTKGSLESLFNVYKKNNFFVPEVYGGINEKECSSMLKNFFISKR